MATTATGSKARSAPQPRRVWAGAGPQRATRTGAGAYRGGLPPTACFTSFVNVYVALSKQINLVGENCKKIGRVLTNFNMVCTLLHVHTTALGD